MIVVYHRQSCLEEELVASRVLKKNKLATFSIQLILLLFLALVMTVFTIFNEQDKKAWVANMFPNIAAHF